MAFAKGQSGNPGGRPKESSVVKALAREYTEEAVLKLAHWMRTDDARASVAACTALLDRGYGKPTQPVSGDDDMPPVGFQKIERVIVSPNPADTDGQGI